MAAPWLAMLMTGAAADEVLQRRRKPGKRRMKELETLYFPWSVLNPERELLIWKSSEDSLSLGLAKTLSYQRCQEIAVNGPRRAPAPSLGPGSVSDSALFYSRTIIFSEIGLSDAAQAEPKGYQQMTMRRRHGSGYYKPIICGTLIAQAKSKHFLGPHGSHARQDIRADACALCAFCSLVNQLQMS